MVSINGHVPCGSEHKNNKKSQSDSERRIDIALSRRPLLFCSVLLLHFFPKIELAGRSVFVAIPGLLHRLHITGNVHSSLAIPSTSNWTGN